MPLLGSYGGSSEYAYRGTIDDFPDDFSFVNQSDAIPGQLFTSNQVTITGINNRALVTVSAGASVSVNGGSYVIPTEASPVFIRNNETLTVRTPSTSGQLSDFNKLYTVNVGVGKKRASWEVRTKIVDVDPTPFTFTNITNGEIGIAYTSNEVTISGLESGFQFPASITSGSGQIIKNGAPGVPSVNIINGDRIYLRLIAPFEYSEFPTGSGVKTNSTSVRVGSYSTSWSVSSRNVDVFVDPFDFNDVNNALVSSVYTAESVNTLGLVTTITGADQGIPLVTAVSGCELRVDQPAAGGGFTLRRDFSTQNAVVFNGDKLTVRITTGPNFSETKVGIVTVSSFAGRFIVTTRPRPIDTIPDRFQFTDIPAQQRGSTVESNEITLSGISTFSDEADASITTGTNGGNGQFQVVRNGSIIRAFGTANTKVRQGDKIKLKLTAATDQNITRSATFRVDGIDTNTVITGQTGFVDDIWSVTSAVRTCDITPFTLANLTNVNPSTQQSTSFIVTGFESDCNMTVNTSNSSSTLTGGGQSGQTISVAPGTFVTVSLLSAPFSQTASTTITVSNPGTIPTKTYSTTWSVTTRADNTPASVSLSANPTTVSSGSPVTLSWSSVNASSVVSTSGEGFFTNLLNGSTTVVPTTSQTYSITVQPNSAASNAGSNVSSSANVTVSDDLSPTITVTPTSLTNQTLGSQASFNVSFAGLTQGKTTSASISLSPSASLTVRDNSTGGTVSPSNFTISNGSSFTVTFANSSTSNTTITGTVSAGLNPTATANFSTATTSCTVTTGSLSIATGVTVIGKDANVTYQNGSTGTLRLYTGRSGNRLGSPAGPGSTSTSNQNVVYSGSMSQSGCTVNSSGDGSVQAVNCGGGDSSTCQTSTSVKHYLITFKTSLVNPSFNITSFNKTTAGGTSDSTIFRASTQREGTLVNTTGYRVWFCRNATNNKGNTHISGLSWSASGTSQVTTTTPADSYNTVIDTILDTFISNASRPPSLNEVKQFVDFYAAGNRTLQQLQTQIVNSLNTSNKASSFTNNCGGPF
jgi:hypothetical protein